MTKKIRVGEKVGEIFLQELRVVNILLVAGLILVILFVFLGISGGVLAVGVVLIPFASFVLGLVYATRKFMERAEKRGEINETS